VSEPAVVAEELSRSFGAFVAVDRLSFRVETGEVFGFLGPNGAGKSTAIRMLCGILRPSGGRARVGGFDVGREPDRVKERIGYMSQRFSLYLDLTVAENLRFYAGVYGLTERRWRERAAWAVEMAGLTGQEDRLAKGLAGGWKQRLALGCALLHEPPILFLDEPTSGVDPISRRRFWELIHRLRAGGTTVLVTTHFLDEAEHCDRLVLIYRGRIVALDEPARLKRTALEGTVLEVLCDAGDRAVELLRQEPMVRQVSPFGRSVHVLVDQAEPGAARVRALLDQAGIETEAVVPIEPSLEDVFIHLIEAVDARSAVRGVAG
jgi:ABC-2 type transport system ATP-binding protein